MTTLGASSEVGRLRTVMLHRPGNELKRLTPRNNDRLLFDGIPWVARAQDEHDAFAAALRDRDVEVLYLIDLLTETFAEEDVRAETDMNIVMTGDGRFVEVQGTAEADPFERPMLDALLDLGAKVCDDLTRIQQEALSGPLRG